jgi:hypothetical protein
MSASTPTPTPTIAELPAIQPQLTGTITGTGGSYESDYESKYQSALHDALLHVYEEIKPIYEPTFSVLEANPPKKLLPELMTLLHVTHNISASNSYGIYHVKNASAALKKFILKQMTTHQQFIKQIRKEERPYYLASLEDHPMVSVSSLVDAENEDTVQPASIQFFLVGKNLMLPSLAFLKAKLILELDEEVIEELYKEACAFFQEGELYLLYKDTETVSIANQVYEVNLNQVQLQKNTVTIKKLSYFHVDSYITLHDMMKVNESMVFYHTMLSLSLFIGLKDSIAK